jgi:stage V sporulation protein G
MEITEVRVRLVRNKKDDQLRAFCSMTLDDEFVVRDIKVIEGAHGYFVAMPSRKMGDHCSRCGGKNHLGAKFCNGCGAKLPANRVKKDLRGRAKLHADVAHPISADCRQRIHEALVAAYEEEFKKSSLPGYKPILEDDTDDNPPDRI